MERSPASADRPSARSSTRTCGGPNRSMILHGRSEERYPAACREILASAKRRPGMYFRRLSELEHQMSGHGTAFLQLGLIRDRNAAFNAAFGEWLAASRGCSLAAGWAVAVEELARATDSEAEVLFFELVEEFLDSWEVQD